MRIRSARSDESAGVLALAVAFYAEGGFATEPDELATNLAVLVEDNSARVAVAVDQTTLVGFAITTVGFGLENGRIAVLEDLYMAPEHRRRGIGRSLVEDSARWAGTMGSSQVELVVAPNGQDVSHLFGYYANLGFLNDDRRLLSRPLVNSGHGAKFGREGAPSVRVERYTGPRSVLRPLFELAEDSPGQLDSYLHAGRVLVARSAGEIVGHLQLVDTGRPGVAEIKNMAVRPADQGRGLGGRLVSAALDLVAAENGSAVRVATAAADIDNLRFYQRHGFRLSAIERDAFTPATGYPEIRIDGIDLRDRVWLDHDLT
jgi:ribosomal protein S18 acetylase RimI-like enzyme